jgi:hypothetical protein
MQKETQTEQQLLQRMETQIAHWQSCADRREIFLRCYMMMTSNTLAAIGDEEFRDPPWVARLLQRFAEYYFEALHDYDHRPGDCPEVWRLTHDAAKDEKTWALQHLLLGVNAHINYDLALTVAELLQDEWDDIGEAKRVQRYEDYCQVNVIIARTIDAVQDEVLQPAMPVMGVLDAVMGRMDEFLISRFITRWRDTVWDVALALMHAPTGAERSQHESTLERRVRARAEAIAERRWRSILIE